MPFVRPAAPALCLLCLPLLAGCGAQPPRDVFPVYGTLRLEPPAEARGITIERVSMPQGSINLDPQRRRILRDFAVELRVRDGGTLTAADFELLRMPLAAVELSPDDDLAPRQPSGLADGATDDPEPTRVVAPGETVWLVFRGVQLRALNAAGGHPIPLVVHLRHRDGATWALMEPARGLPAWKPDTPDLFGRVGWGAAVASGRDRLDAPNAPFGGSRGGSGLGTSFEFGGGVSFDGPAVWATGDIHISTRDVFAEEGLDPRFYGHGSMQLGLGALAGWRHVGTTLGGARVITRLGVGWRVAWILEALPSAGDLTAPATIHSLPIEFAWGFVASAHAPLPLIGGTDVAVGNFIRLQPRLGTLTGDPRYGEGFDLIMGIELTPGS